MVTSRVLRAVRTATGALGALGEHGEHGDDAGAVLLRLVVDEAVRVRGLPPLPGAATAVAPEVAEAVRTALAPVADPATLGCAELGAIHEALLTRAGTRKASGSYYTPAVVVERLLDEALEPALDEVGPGEVTVCDPACGAGQFLVAAATRIAGRLVGAGHPPDAALRTAVGRLHGVDVDPVAVELTRASLWLLAPGAEPELRVGDALLGAPPGTPDPDAWCARLVERPQDAWFHWEREFPAVFARGGFDVVVGNPPFLNRLERATAVDRAVAALCREAAGGAVAAYTDLSAVFLQRSTTWVRPRGRIALVQPQSLLSARDAAPVRRAVAQACALTALWASAVPVFGANVLTCAPVLRRGVGQGDVRRLSGPGLDHLGDQPATTARLAGEWSFLVADGLGVPAVELPDAHGVLGDLATCTADFRDQYYGLVDHVREADGNPQEGEAALVTTGLIDPAHCAWGERATRFAKRRWRAPVVPLDALDPRMARWARARLVPKLLVAAQGPVLEPVVDVYGAWLPSVPTLTVTTEPDRLWHVMAVLLAPPVVAHAAARYAGSGLTMTSVKLSARQLVALPLPAPGADWDAAADHARAAQQGPAHERPDRLREVARAMVAAYGTGEPALDWWCERAGLTGRMAGGGSTSAHQPQLTADPGRAPRRPSTLDPRPVPAACSR